MTENAFAKLDRTKLVALTEEEMATFHMAVDAIIDSVEKARAEGETCAKVDARLYGDRPMIKYYLMKELIKIDFSVESISCLPAAGFRVKWCDEGILDVHRKRRLERIEAGMPCQKRKKEAVVEPFLETPSVEDE